MLLYVGMLQHGRQKSVVNRQIQRTPILSYVTLITVKEDSHNSAHLRRELPGSRFYQRWVVYKKLYLQYRTLS
jgi:hypothetical protein